MQDQEYMDFIEGRGLDVAKFGIRVAESVNMRSVGLNKGETGYMIPYFDIDGEPLEFYRIVYFKGDEMQFKSVKQSVPSLYIPPNFLELAKSKNHKHCLVFRNEDEAFISCQKGILAVATGAIASWRKKILQMSKDTEITETKDKYVFTTGMDMNPDEMNLYTDRPLNISHFVNFCIRHEYQIIIASQKPKGEIEAQREGDWLFQTCVEFIEMGIEKINIGAGYTPENITERDMIFTKTKEEIINSLDATFHFPRHPNIKLYISKLTRFNNMSSVARAGISIIADMDHRGTRMIASHNDSPGYFDNNEKKVYESWIGARHHTMDPEFADIMERRYGVNTGKYSLCEYLRGQIKSAKPCEKKATYKAFCFADDAFYFHISQSRVLRLKDDKFSIIDNGDEVFFITGKSEKTYRETPIDEDVLMEEIERQTQDFKPLWREIIGNVNIQRGKTEMLSAVYPLICYLSPFMNGWQGLQLPIELLQGETGAGKTSLAELRLKIICGYEYIPTMPKSASGFHASIADCSAIHCLDNYSTKGMGAVVRDMHTQYCNLITANQPVLRVRKDFLVKINNTFMITSVSLPLHSRADFQSRAFHLPLNRNDGNKIDDWANYMLRQIGGREVMFANQVVAIAKFLELSNERWDESFRSSHRLSGLEQALLLMGEICDVSKDIIMKYITSHMEYVYKVEEKNRDAELAEE